MEMKVDRVPAGEFIGLWNNSDTFEAVVEQVRQRVGSVPRWSVLARAVALRKAGTPLKQFVADQPGEGSGPRP